MKYELIDCKVIGFDCSRNWASLHHIGYFGENNDEMVMRMSAWKERGGELLYIFSALIHEAPILKKSCSILNLSFSGLQQAYKFLEYGQCGYAEDFEHYSNLHWCVACHGRCKPHISIAHMF